MKRKAIRQKRGKICEICKTTFYPWYKNQRFCGMKCAYIGRKSIYKPETHLKIKCFQCGIIVDKPRSLIKENKSSFCDTECYRIWLKGKNKGKRNPNYKNALRKYTCKKCRKVFYSYSKKRKYCSYICASMGKNLKALGSRTEREVFKILKEKGFYVVKSGGSLGLFDIWAVNDNELKLIQVKAVNRIINPEMVFKNEIRKIRNAKCMGNKEFWVRFLINKPTKTLIEKFKIIKL